MYRRLIHKVGFSHPHFELSRLRNSPKLPAPGFATISLVLDSEGHKPIVMITTAVVLLTALNGPVLSIMVHKQLVPGVSWCLICLGLMGFSPRPHVDRQVGGGGGGITLLKTGYQLPKREIIVMLYVTPFPHSHTTKVYGNITLIGNIIIISVKKPLQTASQGRIQGLHGGGGAAPEIVCPHTHRERETRRPFYIIYCRGPGSAEDF